MCSYCKIKADLTRFNNRVKWSYYVHANTCRTGEGKRVHCLLQKKYLKKVICVFAQEPYGLLRMLFGNFVRSVEDGLEQTSFFSSSSYTKKGTATLMITMSYMKDLN